MELVAGGQGKQRLCQSNSGKVQGQSGHLRWSPATRSLDGTPGVSLISSEGAISTGLLMSFHTALQKASPLSLTNLAALIYSRERSCTGMCWQAH